MKEEVIKLLQEYKEHIENNKKLAQDSMDMNDSTTRNWEKDFASKERYERAEIFKDKMEKKLQEIDQVIESL